MINLPVKISIIMPSFNGAKTIKESILSVVNNKYENKELIIVDGKSDDESHEIIADLVSKYSCIKWIKESDQGLSDAINIGLAICTGDIIGYLGSDDLLNVDTLVKVNENKNLVDFDAIYFDSYTYYLDKKFIKLRKCPAVQFSRKNLIKYMTIVGLQDIFFDKKVFTDIKYDAKNRYSMDYDVYFKVVKKFSNFMYVEYPATINKFHNNISYQSSRNQTKEAMNVMYKHLKFKDCIYLPYKRVFKDLFRKLVG
ncbi:glycosyltransferase [Francisellaceae bacterium CB300]